MSFAIYPGSFDPPTYGHLDIIRRASARFDKVVVCVMHNGVKSHSMFSCNERKDMLVDITSDLSNVTIDTYGGMLTEYIKQYQNPVVIRGLRAISDFEYELQMSSVNKKLNSDMETIFMLANSEYTYLSSSVVRELATYGGKLSSFVPEQVEKLVLEKIINSEVQ